MKKTYTTPEAEKIQFNYRDQVVAASSNCKTQFSNQGPNTCTSGWIPIGYTNVV